jgi:tRNA-2-methylthio-N6-dimethylallyladenosine synthase
MTLRELPMLDPVALPSAAPGRPAATAPERVAEFAADSLVMPRFHVWTLGCQMNHADSEQMAGALLEAGCAESPSLESADLVVINSCAIREAAEQKVIGRMGALARLREANPQLRVVLTGCSVRADNAKSLARRYPQIDLFLRPDEEPELVARLGLASATAPGALGGGGDGASFQRVGRSVAATADPLPQARAAAVRAGTVARTSRSHAWLPIVYGCDKTCTYCIVPFSRGPERSRPFDEILDEARALAADGVRDVTLLGQNVNSYGHDLPPEPRFSSLASAS